MSRGKQGRKRTNNRRDRITFGQTRNQLSLDEATTKRITELGCVPRWVNDSEGGSRLKLMFDKGYDFLKADGTEIIGDADGSYQAPDSGTHMKKHVGASKSGEPMYAYLMVQHLDNYEEDLSAKEAVNSQVDDAIRAGAAPGAQETGHNSEMGSTFVKEIKYNP